MTEKTENWVEKQKLEIAQTAMWHYAAHIVREWNAWQKYRHVTTEDLNQFRDEIADSLKLNVSQEGDTYTVSFQVTIEGE